MEPAGSNSGRARSLSGVSPAVASLPKGGDGYEEVHRIRFAFPSTFDSIYDKSKLTAHTSKCSG